MQVLPPPLTSQPSASHHVAPNSEASQPSTVVNTGKSGHGVLRKGSTIDDESWMYNYDQVMQCIICVASHKRLDPFPVLNAR